MELLYQTIYGNDGTVFFAEGLRYGWDLNL